MNFEASFETCILSKYVCTWVRLTLLNVLESRYHYLKNLNVFNNEI